MMLKSFLPKIEQRYVFVGSAVGAVLPAAFFTVSKFTGYAGSFTDWALENPSQFTLAAMPVWMGLVALQFARNRKRQLEAEAIRRQQEMQLLHDALHDHLTGLKNRAAFHATARKTISDDVRYALLLLDLDKFKMVNDTKGHQAGDQLLIEVAARLRQIEANWQGLTAFRLGGDEFVLLLGENSTQDRLEALATAIEEAICEPVPISGDIVNVGVSIGIAEAQQSGEALDAVMQRADLALYNAKDSAGSGHMFYDKVLADASLSRLEMERDLVAAVASGEFVLEFQPLLCAHNKEVVAMQALLRWLHPQKGLLGAERFVPAAERCGLMRKIDGWLINAACMEAAQWPVEIGISVDISRAQFEDESFPSYLVRCLDRSGLAPHRLTIDLSESVVALGEDLVRARLEQLRILGVRVALHDFGLSLHALNQVIEMDVDGLKLERNLTESVLSGQRGTGLMDAIAQFGAAIKVANSNETDALDQGSVEFVRVRGASEVQRYLSSKPIPASSVARFLKGELPDFDSVA